MDVKVGVLDDNIAGVPPFRGLCFIPGVTGLVAEL
jgi:hypothetical protein